nr:hypothetical protein [Tanacetum cinerariifolium]
SFRLRVEVAGKAAVEAQATFRRACAVSVLAGQHAEGHRRIRQQTAFLTNGDFRQTDFEAAVEQPDVTDLARLDLFVQHLKHFQQRRERRVAVGVAQLAEEVGAAFRPMQLIQVQVVGLQAFQAGVDGGNDMVAVEFQLAVTNVVDAVAGACDLAGENPVGAVAVLFEPVTDDGLGAGV